MKIVGATIKATILARKDDSFPLLIYCGKFYEKKEWENVFLQKNEKNKIKLNFLLSFQCLTIHNVSKHFSLFFIVWRKLTWFTSQVFNVHPHLIHRLFQNSNYTHTHIKESSKRNVSLAKEMHHRIFIRFHHWIIEKAEKSSAKSISFTIGEVFGWR